jgi:uncharacterized membrane protein
MTRRQLLRVIDRELVRNAIERAERRTSGEICVSVAPLFWGNVRKAAEKAFTRMGMTQTKERNGVLLFVVPSRRKFTILGDQGIHDKVGQDFWNGIAAVLSEKFHDGDYTGGLVAAIDAVGEQLASHFPYGEQDKNELPNELDFT